MNDKPILFIDVDGVLNPIDGWISGRITNHDGYVPHLMKPDVLMEQFPGIPLEKIKPLTVILNRNHGVKLLSLGCELVWATTWEHAANEWISPELDLPELPVVTFPTTSEHFFNGQWMLSRKTKSLVEYANGRPFAWVDDDITDYDSDFIRENASSDCLPLCVDSDMGLMDHHFTILDAWVRGLDKNVH